MKYFLIGVVMLVIAYIYALLLTKAAEFATKHETEEGKDILQNTRTRLEHVLLEEGEEIGDYMVTAKISKGEIEYLEICTDKTEASIEKEKKTDEYSVKEIKYARRTAIMGITGIIFIVEFCFLVMLLL